MTTATTPREDQPSGSIVLYHNSRGERVARYRREDGHYIYGRGATDGDAIEDLVVRLKRCLAWEADDGLDEWNALPLEPGDA